MTTTLQLSALLMLFSTPLASGQTPIELECLPGWTLIGFKCYRLYTEIMPWSSAQRVCSSYGGHLATPKDFYVNNEIGSFLNQAGIDEFWIGYNDAEESLQVTPFGSLQYKDDQRVGLWVGRWMSYQPSLELGQCVFVSKNAAGMYGWTVFSCAKKMPSLCQRTVCAKGTFQCQNGKCISHQSMCNEVDECGDGSDEMNCPSLCRHFLTQDTGRIQYPFNGENYSNNVNCLWLIEVAVGRNIRLTVESLAVEAQYDELIVMDGGLTVPDSEVIVSSNGPIAMHNSYYSSNNMMIISFKTDGAGNDAGFNLTYEEVTAPLTDIRLTATDSIKILQSHLYTVYQLGSKDYTYIISAMNTMGPISLRFLNFELAEGSQVIIRDSDTVLGNVLATFEGSYDGNRNVISSGKDIHLTLKTRRGGRTMGFLLRYQQGCQAVITASSGFVSSPGFGVTNYPTQVTCTWQVNVPGNRRSTVIFNSFDIDTADSLLIYDNNDVKLANYTGSTQPPSLNVASGSFRVVLNSGPTVSKSGFNLTFSVDCPDLGLDLSRTDVMDYNLAYDSSFTVSCKTGAAFTALEHIGQTSVTLHCQAYEQWNVNTSPICNPTYCAQAPLLENGYVESSAGNLSYGGYIKYKCFSGFQISDLDSAFCGADGQWSALPVCTETQCGSHPQAPARGSVQLKNGDGSTYGSIVVFSCDEGYEIIGSTTMVCDSNGWQGNVPTCDRITCHMDNVADGSLSDNTAHYRVSIILTCNNGFITTTDGLNATALMCTSSRRFNSYPECTNVNECNQNPSPCAQMCKDTPGSYECSCRAGYKASGPLCQDIDECSPVSPCDHNCVNTDGSYHCTCRSGFVLYETNGTEGLYIPQGETGNLPGDVYRLNHTCVPIRCPTIPSPSNAHILEKRGSHFYTDVIQFQCDMGYVWSPSDSKGGYYFCSNNGLFESISSSSCQVAKCNIDPVPGSISNPATLIPSSGQLSYDESVRILCNRPGLSPSASFERIRRCVQIAGTYQLDGSVNDYDCGLISCGPPESQPDSIFLNQMSYNFGDSFTFACKDSSFTVKGQSEIYQNSTVPCMANGAWGFGSLSCPGVQCQDPGQPFLGEQVQSDYRQGRTTTFGCTLPGYSLQPATGLTCQYPNFTGSLPLCVDTQKPTISNCPPRPIQLAVPGRVSSVIPALDFSDNGGIKKLTVNSAWPPTNLYIAHIGQEEMFTYTYYDFNDNTESCTVEVIGEDTFPPEIECPSGLEQTFSGTRTITTVLERSMMTSMKDETSPLENLVVTFSPSSVTFDPTTMLSLSVPPVFDETVTASVTDEAGNTASCQFQVHYEPNLCDPLSLRQPVNSTKSCSSSGSGYTCTIACHTGAYLYNTNGQTQTDVTCPGPDQPFVGGDVYCVDIAAQSFEGYYKQVVTSVYRGVGLSASCIDAYKSSIVSVFNDYHAEIFINCQTLNGTITPTLILGEDNTSINITLTVFYDRAVGANYLLCSRLIDPILEFPQDYFDGRLEIIEPSACPEITFDLSDKIFEGYYCLAGLLSLIPERRREVGYCFACPAGTFSDGQNCTQCPVGTFSTQTNSSSCTPCPGAKSTYQEGSPTEAECLSKCTTGTFSSNGLPPCSNCPVNHYWVNSTFCEACPTGSISRSDNRNNVNDCKLSCPPGKYNLVDGHEPCIQCPNNYYSDENGATQCKQCDATKFTLGSGSNSSSSCVLLSLFNFCTPRCLHGTCAEKISNFVSCECDDGWYGEFCETPFDPCHSHPCYNGGNCIIDNSDRSQYTCSCPTGTSGPNCGTIVKTCTPDYCANNGMCENLVNAAKCHCLPGYSGESCLQTQSICATNDCQNGAQCVPFGDVRFTCECTPGFTGPKCAEEIDDCYSSPCRNGGSCQDVHLGYTCDCEEGFSGTNCEIRRDPCNGVTCGQGTCIPDETYLSYICVCDSGASYTPAFMTSYSAENGQRYEKVDTSLVNGPAVAMLNCNQQRSCDEFILESNQFQTQSATGSNGITGMKFTKYRFASNAPYLTPFFDVSDPTSSGSTGEEETLAKILQLTSITPCQTSNVVVTNCLGPGTCSPDGLRCTHGVGSCSNAMVRFLCATPAPRNQLCAAIDFCSPDPCNNGATCNTATKSCTCAPGYDGLFCQHDTNECENTPCKNGGACTDQVNAYQCDCSGTGYEGTDCTLEIDECSRNPCDIVGMKSCTDEVNGRECICKPGFVGMNCETNINECASEPCMHGGQCSDQIDDYSCSCPSGWTGKNCQNEITYCSVGTCNNGGTCFDVFGDFFCSCLPNTFGETCNELVDICSVADPCLDGACSSSGGSTSCDCPWDYIGDRCQHMINYCNTSGICENGGTCIPSLNSFMCDCEEGFSGQHCRTNVDNCPTANCPSNAQCIDMINIAYCRCPFEIEGPRCDRVWDQNWDLLFDGRGSADMLYPLQLDSASFSITLWIQFEQGNTEGTVLSIYTVPSPNSLDDKEMFLWIDEKSVFLNTGSGMINVTNDIHYNLDGKWHYLVVNVDGTRGEMFFVVNTINSEPVHFTPGTHFSENIWLTLGCKFDTEEDKCSEEGAFKGKLSRVSMYSQTLELRNDITLVGNINVSAVFPNPLLLWGELWYPFGVTRISPSTADSGCPIGFINPPSCTRAPGTNRVSISSGQCPSDMVIFSDQRLKQITWDTPSFTGQANTISTARSGDIFTWGHYRIIIQASNVDGNKALCLFSIFVRNQECPTPEKPPHVQTLECHGTGHYSGCMPTCEAGYGYSRPSPFLHTCGPSGNWNPLERYSPYRITPCGERRDSIRNLFIRMTFLLPTIECSAVVETLNREIRITMVELNMEWDSLCQASDCGNVTINVRCVNGRRKRQTNLDVSAVLTLFNVGLYVNQRQNPANRVLLTDLFISLLNARTNNPFDYTALVADAIPVSHTISEDNVCFEPQVLLQGFCVDCGPGTYFNATSKSCLFCAINHYQPLSAQRNCIPCDGNNVTEQEGSWSASQCYEMCNQGHYFEMSTQMCTECPRGFYQPDSGKFHCLPCSVNTTTRDPGTVLETSCTNDCPAGKQISSDNTCEDCPIGFYRLDEPICEKCADHLVTQMTGSLYQSQCDVANNPAGTYRLRNNETFYESCPIGEYQPLEYQWECIPCGTGFRTDNLGSTSRDDCKFFCPAGKQKIAGQNACELCPLGTFRDGSNFYSDCEVCPGGFYTEQTGSISQSSCTFFRCNVGQEPVGDTAACIECPRGSYQNEPDQKACIQCTGADSTRSTGSTSSTQCESFCPSGFEKRSGSCQECDVGFFKNNNIDIFSPCTRCSDLDYVTPGNGSTSEADCTVLDCREGSFVNLTTMECIPCSLGTYQDQKYQTECKPCQNGTSTRNTRSTSSSECESFCSSGSEKLPNGNCQECDIGYFKDNSVGLFSSCTLCSDSNFATPNRGSTSESECTVFRCLIGEQPTTSNTACEQCPRGFYQNEPNQQSCKSCTGQDSTRTVGSTSLAQCESYCASGEEKQIDGSCVRCAIGFFKDNSIDLFSSCQQCSDPNLVTPGTGAQSDSNCTVYRCQEGEQPNASNTGCMPCPLGFYQNLPGQTACIGCTGNKVSTRTTGSTDQSQCEGFCDSGYEKNSDGNCQSCDVGFFKDNTIDRFGECTRCTNASFVTPGRGSTTEGNCTVFNCLEGYFINGNNNGCESCPLGTYQDKKYQTTCTDCETGTSTRSIRSTSSTDCEMFCPSGFEKIGANCLRCPRGTYKDNTISEFMICTDCRTGFTTPENVPATSGTQCTVPDCQAGSFIDGSVCTNCTIGTYQDEPLQIECKPCGTDKTTTITGATDASFCRLNCPQGKENLEGTDVCSECEKGFYKDHTGSTECSQCVDDLEANNIMISSTRGATSRTLCNTLACSPGYFPQGAVCQKCGYGFFQPVKWQTACMPCVVGKTTYILGATSSDQCWLICPPGQEYKENTATCAPCPIGFYRNGLNATSYTCTECHDGYITGSDGSVDITNCTVKDCSTLGMYRDPADNTCKNCPIATYQDTIRQDSCKPCNQGLTTRFVKSNQSTDCLPDCNAGFEVHPTSPTMCRPCTKGFYRSKDVWNCQPCPSGLDTSVNSAAENVAACDVSTCEKGSVYKHGSGCVLCELNTYQDQSGQLGSCKQCQNGTTTDGPGKNSSADCKSICESRVRCASQSEVCVPNSSSQGFECVCAIDHERNQGTNQCQHKCVLNYCGTHGVCKRSPLSCTCTDEYSGIQCQISPPGSSFADKKPERILIGTITGVSAFLLLLLLLVFICRRSRKKSRENNHLEDQTSTATKSVRSPDDWPTFAAMNPAFSSKPPSVVTGPSASLPRQSVMFSSSDEDPAVYKP